MNRRRAFEFLCGLLSLDESPALRDRLRRMAQSGTIPWDAFVAHAGRQWVSAAVSHALHRKDLKKDLPEDLTDFFDGMATLNRQRNDLIRVETLGLTRILNGVGIRPIFLKGAANLLAGLYPDRAQRMMLDVDVLLPAGQLMAGVTALHANGYNQLSDIGIPAHHHYPPLGQPGATASVELHVEPLDYMARRFLSGAEIAEQAVELSIEGARFAVPSTFCRLVHGVAHTHFSDHAYILGQLSLRELLDTALLTSTETIDWRAISARFDARHGKTALAFHLLAADRLLGARNQDAGTAGGFAHLLFRRAQFQANYPRLQAWNKILLWPWLMLMRCLSHPLLRRRLFRSVFDRTWYVRQWRVLRSGKI
jgi:hypothetical protein